MNKRFYTETQIQKIIKGDRYINYSTTYHIIFARVSYTAIIIRINYSVVNYSLVRSNKCPAIKMQDLSFALSF